MKNIKKCIYYMGVLLLFTINIVYSGESLSFFDEHKWMHIRMQNLYPHLDKDSLLKLKQTSRGMHKEIDLFQLLQKFDPESEKMSYQVIESLYEDIFKRCKMILLKKLLFSPHIKENTMQEMMGIFQILVDYLKNRSNEQVCAVLDPVIMDVVKLKINEVIQEQLQLIINLEEMERSDFIKKLTLTVLGDEIFKQFDTIVDLIRNYANTTIFFGSSVINIK